MKKYMAALMVILFLQGCATTPIRSSIKSGNLPEINQLIRNGANINEVGSDGSTPLMYSIWHSKHEIWNKSKRAEVSKYLIESGADVKVKDGNKYDALLYAVDYRQNELIKILLDKGADIESTDYAGMTPLAKAVWQTSDVDSVKLLIKMGANVNAKNDEGQTILDFALAIRDGKAILCELLKAGVDLFSPDGKETARIIFIGENFFSKDTVCLAINEINKCLNSGNEVNFVDIASGVHNVIIPGSLLQKKIELPITVKSGNVYYVNVRQQWGGRVAGIIAGTAAAIPGGALLVMAASATGQIASEAIGGSDPFMMTIIPEASAKEKISKLLTEEK